MIILALRTDKPDAEIGLFNDHAQLGYETWYAHRALSTTLHQKIQGLLQAHGKTLHDVQGIVGYQGPGSFTGLRIGLSVANALAAGLRVPAAGATGEAWAEDGIAQLLAGKGERLIMPEYGAAAHITVQKK